MFGASEGEAKSNNFFYESKPKAIFWILESKGQIEEDLDS